MNESAFDRVSTLELLAFSDDIPSLPDRFIKVQKVIQDPGYDANDLAKVIRSDQATTAMILKFANSPVYNPSGIRIAELSQAIARLGSKETVHIATAMSLMYGLIMPTGMANVRAFWSHAFAVATLCEKLAQQIDPFQEQCKHETAFMVGLLHDIGRAALGLRVDLSYFERDLGHLHLDTLVDKEESFYGVNHAEAGQKLLSRWLFPDEFCQVVAEHHDPDSSLLLARICNVANQYAIDHLSDRTPFESIPEELFKAMADDPPDISWIVS